MIRLALLLALAATAAHAQSPLSADAVRARLADRTSIAGEGPDRWQVEYTAADGAAWIWQPGAPPLAGRWSVREHRGETQVCFTYPVNATTPGEEKCGDAAYPLGLKGKVAIESGPGDLFGIASGKASVRFDKPLWPGSYKPRSPRP